jgi:hypothetical protein
MKDPIQRLVLTFMACFIAVLLALTFACFEGALSPRGFGVAGPSLMVGGCVLLAVLLRRTQKRLSNDPEEPQRKIERLQRRILGQKLLIGILAVGLLAGLLQLRDPATPLLPFCVGVAINQLLMWSSVAAIRRMRRQLDQAVGQLTSSEPF